MTESLVAMSLLGASQLECIFCPRIIELNDSQLLKQNPKYNWHVEREKGNL